MKGSLSAVLWDHFTTTATRPGRRQALPLGYAAVAGAAIEPAAHRRAAAPRLARYFATVPEV